MNSVWPRFALLSSVRCQLVSSMLLSVVSVGLRGIESSYVSALVSLCVHMPCGGKVQHAPFPLVALPMRNSYTNDDVDLLPIIEVVIRKVFDSKNKSIERLGIADTSS
jgi:hypothetical protein